MLVKKRHQRLRGRPDARGVGGAGKLDHLEMRHDAFHPLHRFLVQAVEFSYESEHGHLYGPEAVARHIDERQVTSARDLAIKSVDPSRG